MTHHAHFLQIVIVDDQQSAIDVIMIQAAKCEQVVVALATTDAFEAIRFCRDNPVDAVFLDIRMDLMNGFEFIEQLRYPPLIVLTTAYKEFALEGHQIGVIDYLVKPVDFGQFARAMQRVEEHRLITGIAQKPAGDDGEPRIALPVEHKKVLINLKDIILMKADKNVTWVHLLTQDYRIDDRKKAIARQVDVRKVNTPFGKLYGSLPYPQFVQVHRSYAVALEMIHEFHGGYLTLNHLDNKHVSVSQPYQEVLAKLLDQLQKSK